MALCKEDGVDISHHFSSHVDEYQNIEFDYVITICNQAKKNCPWFPSNAIRLHQNFEDPAQAKGTEEEIITRFRKVRDQIKAYSIEFTKKYIGRKSIF